MKGKAGRRRFSRSDHIALGASLLLAFAMWLIHNLSLTYSDVVQCRVVIRCNIDGYADVSDTPVEVAARCSMDGYNMLGLRTFSGTKEVEVVQGDLHSLEKYASGMFYMSAQELTKYSHIIFGEDAHLEYFLSDTMLFHFQKVNYKKVSVNPVISLDFRAQYMPISSLRVSPDSVILYGDERILRNIEMVNTSPIHQFDVNSEIYGESSLQPVKGVRMSHQKVEYSMNVARYVECNLQVPVKVVGVPRGKKIRVYPSSAYVRVKSVYPIMEDLDDIVVQVNYKDFASSISGKCVGYVSGMPVTAISGSEKIEPEVFECILQ